MKRDARILIVGGGIGSITLAYWLHKYGFQPTVVEKAKQFGNVGYAISATGHSLEIMDKMALTAALVEKAYHLEYGVMMTDQGRVLKQFSMERFTSIEHGSIGINRADLHLLLYSTIENTVDFRFGCTVSSISESDSCVDVEFDDGTQESFDVVIGADGIHSSIRDTVFGSGFEQYLNMSYMAFMTPNIGIPSANHDVFGDGRMVSLGGYSGDEVGAFFLFKTAPGQKLTPAERKAKLLELYGGFKWRVLDVIDSIADPSIIFYDDLIQIKMPQWSRGRIALLGDAAYCLSPLSGKGASMAIFGGYYLADQLANFEYEEAFERYQTRMYAGIIRFQKQTLSFSKTVLPEGSFPVTMRNVITQCTPNTFIYRLFTNEITERI